MGTTAYFVVNEWMTGKAKGKNVQSKTINSTKLKFTVLSEAIITDSCTIPLSDCSFDFSFISLSGRRGNSLIIVVKVRGVMYSGTEN